MTEILAIANQHIKELEHCEAVFKERGFTLCESHSTRMKLDYIKVKELAESIYNRNLQEQIKREESCGK